MGQTDIHMHFLFYIIDSFHAQVSATQVLWLVGLYQLSLSSAVGNLCGCPTALMGVAADRVITFLNPLSKGVSHWHILYFIIKKIRKFDIYNNQRIILCTE